VQRNRQLTYWNKQTWTWK